MRLVGKEHLLEPLNRQALVIAQQVAMEAVEIHGDAEPAVRPPKTRTFKSQSNHQLARPNRNPRPLAIWHCPYALQGPCP